MNIMNLYVYENRSMSNDLTKPLMLENLNVDTVQVHIPKDIDGTDMGTWAWWFVYQNAKREKYSIPMTLEGVTSAEGKEEYISTVGLNHGFTGKHGTVMYAIEAVQADGSGAATHEWHTKTYKLEIVYTLQGNQTEYDESESDIISALISRVNELITSGAEIAEIAETIENAAETAQEVIDSIPSDYSTLSARVGANTIALAEKADQATTYTKAQVDQMIEDVEVETDTTLAVSGAPADAKAVGDELTELKADLVAQVNGHYDERVTLTLIANEYVMATTGEFVSDLRYTRTDYIDTLGAKKITISRGQNPTGTVLNAIDFYDINKIYISGTTEVIASGDNEKTHNIPTNCKYIIYSGSNISMSTTEATLKDIPNAIGNLTETVDKKADVFSTFNNDKYIKQSVLLENIIGVTKFPGNLVDPSECINNAYIGTNEGKQVSSNNYFCTGFIPVTGGMSYKSNLGRNLAWYDSTKTFISGVSGTEIQSGVTAPNNAAYIRFTVNKTTDGIDSPIFLYFSEANNFNTNVIIPGLSVEDEWHPHPWCYGKKINWIGDSIVDGADFDEVVCNALGLTKLTTDGVDGGINGSTIALKANGTDGRNALCLRYSNMPDDADIIAVSAGTNDFEYAWCPIGTIESTDNNTLYGALKTLCEGLITKYPHSVIFFTTPIKRMQPFVEGNGGEYTADYVDTTPFSKNKYGKTLGDYADIIKEVCGLYSIPVLDMYRESLLNPHIVAQQNCFIKEQDSYHETSFYFYTHPNAIGQKIMARRVAGWLTQLGYLIT